MTNVAAGPIDIDHLRGWIGRTEIVDDDMAAFPLNALAATLDRDDSPATIGTPLPPSAHWLYFLPRTRQSELASDGHPARGEFMPPVLLPRRMWAGSRVRLDALLRIGEQARRVSTVEDVRLKEGRSGSLVFVSVRHEISVVGAVCPSIIEEQDIVYCQEASAKAAPEVQRAPEGAAWMRTIHPDPALLFRYSALIFNAHRIHYDQPYVTEKEGYPGLIVHGPLIATLLVNLFRSERPEAIPKAFSFRAVSPLFDTAPFVVAGMPTREGARLWAVTPNGGLAAEAVITL